MTDYILVQELLNIRDDLEAITTRIARLSAASGWSCVYSAGLRTEEAVLSVNGAVETLVQSHI
jgi:hypothetical protein